MKPNSSKVNCKKQYVIGITGGVGAGKTTVLQYLKENYPCVILIADEIGNDVKLPKEVCYHELISLLGNSILDSKGYIDKAKMAECIFGNAMLVEKVNQIIHPAVHQKFLACVDEFRRKNEIPFLFLEAALLIEAGYKEELDELWYISCTAEARKQRLITDRGYSIGRIDGIMSHQLTEKEFLKFADRTIENNGTMSNVYAQIDKIMGEFAWQEQ